MLPRKTKGPPGREAAGSPGVTPDDPALFLAKVTSVSGTGGTAEYAFTEQQVSDAGVAEDRTSGRVGTVLENPARYAGGGTLAVDDLVLVRRSVRDVNEFEVVMAAPVAPGFSGARAYRSTAQSIPNAAFTRVTFEAEVFDVGGYWDAGTPAQLTVPAVGYYLVGAHGAFAVNATGIRAAYLRLGGSVGIAYSSAEAPDFGVGPFSLATLWYFSAGLTAELWVYQNSGGALDLDAGGNQLPALWATRLG